MNLSNVLKRVYQETKVSSVYPVTNLNTPSVFESQAGFLGAVLRIQGVPFEIEEPSTLNHQKFLLHQALITLDSRFIVYITTHRRKKDYALSGMFKSHFAQRLNERYFERFKNQTLYINDLYLTVVLKGGDSNKAASLLHWAKRLSSKSLEIASLQRESSITVLTNAVQQLKANLASFSVSLLGEKDEEVGYSELIQFLSLVVNGGNSLPFNAPLYSPPIATTLPNTFKSETLYPRGHLAQYVSRYQLLFGDTVQFQGNTASDCRFATLLSLKKYPASTVSIILDNLLSLDGEFISTHTFAPLPREVALDRIDKKRSKLISAEDKGVSQTNALADLEDGIASETLLLGAHQHTLMLLADTQHALEEAVLDVTKRYASHGIAVVRETLGIEPAFWSQLPCNHHFITRASLITSENFVDFCPLHNTHQGFNGENFLGSAVTLFETPSKTPVYFNYHTKGSRTNPTKGHTAVFGGNNAGKTTLVNFLDAQMMRFGGRSFYLDRDESSKIYILACGNSAYLKVHPTNPIAMNPLQLPDLPENRAFLKTWMGTLIQKENEMSIPSEMAETINDCIDYAFEQLAPAYRTLSQISQFLPMDFPRWPELRRWLKADSSRIDGEFHWLFDNEQDALNLNYDRVGFDVTFLMDETPSLISTPVYLYLLHRMRQCLDGRLTSFVLAEAWQLFASPFWEKCLKEWLPTIRKKNGHFIFDTQSPKTISNSPIQHIVLDNLATMIVFPNSLADRDTYITQLNLTESEYQFVKEGKAESRLFLYKQGNESMLCKLDLSGLSDEIRVLSGNTKSVNLLDDLMQAVGDSPNDWLPLFIARSQS